MKKYSLPFLFVSLCLGSSGAFGAGWNSSTHFGYAVVERSNTGLAEAAGSVIFLDLDKTLGNIFSLGMRTAATGGEKGQKEYYRLATGPVLKADIFKKWQIELGWGFFNESALENSEKTYTSRGQNLQLGWRRKMVLSSKIALSWGAFFSRHWGSVKKSQTAAATQLSARENTGNIRGLELAINIML